MAYYIKDTCKNCGACEDKCPVDAIDKADGKRVIDNDMCINCGKCVRFCPVDAIKTR
ncbi:MAG: ferredoxin [Calditerrivibrio nitroreducens]|uniref:Ferredoxin n=1 Tax=Calditerrivibrio nitroreducens TaxID=477976 RepID=A0A2J6WRB5_9BACT|nr:MAG: ferredoxin [Calditerrivibrio nitroreducens]